MRLHLNKKLRAALIAAISTAGFTLTQAQAWEGGNEEGSEYYTNTSRTNLHLTNTSAGTITFTAEQNHVTAGIAEVVVKDLATVRVRGGNHWGSGRAFDMLTIDSIKAGDGSGTVFVNVEKYNDSQPASNSTATVLGINGTLVVTNRPFAGSTLEGTVMTSRPITGLSYVIDYDYDHVYNVSEEFKADADTRKSFSVTADVSGLDMGMHTVRLFARVGTNGQSDIAEYSVFIHDGSDYVDEATGDLILGMSGFVGQTGVVRKLSVTGFDSPMFRADSGDVLYVGNLDLSKYKSCVVEYATRANFDVDKKGYTGLVGLKSAKVSYGYETTGYDMTASLAKVDLTEPAEEDDPPVLLKNNGYASNFEWVVAMYSYPKYGTYDPTFIMSIFYFFIFGLMFADVGYGLILILGGLLLPKVLHMKDSMRRMFNMFGYCGFSSVIMGVLFGGWFGDLPYALMVNIGQSFPTTEAAKAAFPLFDGLWVNPINDPMTFLIISLGMGAIHLVAGMAVKFVLLCKEKKVFEAIFGIASWWVIFAGIAAQCASIPRGSSLSHSSPSTVAGAGREAVEVQPMRRTRNGVAGSDALARSRTPSESIYAVSSWTTASAMPEASGRSV